MRDRKEVKGLPFKYHIPFYGRFYQRWQKFIHRHNYHHMELSYPGGDIIAWCHWCGLRDKFPKTSTLSISVTHTKNLNPESERGSDE